MVPSWHPWAFFSEIDVVVMLFSQPIAMPLAVVGSWVEQAVSIVGQTSRCCMVCLMPQSQGSGSFEYPHFNMFTLDRPTCERNWLSAFQVVQEKY